MRTSRQIQFVTFALCLTLLVFASIPVFAEVIGSEGVAPVLTERVPGVERAFPQDTQKFTFAIIGDKTGEGSGTGPSSTVRWMR